MSQFSGREVISSSGTAETAAIHRLTSWLDGTNACVAPMSQETVQPL